MFSFYFNGKTYNIGDIKQKKIIKPKLPKDTKEAAAEQVTSTHHQQEKMTGEICRIREKYFLERRPFL